MTDQEDEEMIDHYGLQIPSSWLEEIQHAQEITEIVIAGKPFDRVRFGDESNETLSDTQPCSDCATLKGQFHVPGCDIEKCPACGGQAISCDCDYEGDSDEEGDFEDDLEEAEE